jgi:hypothetical protein
MTENAIATEMVDAAFRIHTTLGPGLLVSIYQYGLGVGTGPPGLHTVRERPIPVIYENRIDTGFRADLFVEDSMGASLRLRAISGGGPQAPAPPAISTGSGRSIDRPLLGLRYWAAATGPRATATPSTARETMLPTNGSPTKSPPHTALLVAGSTAQSTDS